MTKKLPARHTSLAAALRLFSAFCVAKRQPGEAQGIEAVSFFAAGKKDTSG
jgi:hypothetical protein